MGADVVEALVALVLLSGYFRFMALLFKAPAAWPESIMLALLMASCYLAGATIS